MGKYCSSQELSFQIPNPYFAKTLCDFPGIIQKSVSWVGYRTYISTNNSVFDYPSPPSRLPLIQRSVQLHKTQETQSEDSLSKSSLFHMCVTKRGFFITVSPNTKHWCTKNSRNSIMERNSTVFSILFVCVCH